MCPAQGHIEKSARKYADGLVDKMIVKAKSTIPWIDDSYTSLKNIQQELYEGKIKQIESISQIPDTVEAIAMLPTVKKGYEMGGLRGIVTYVLNEKMQPGPGVSDFPINQLFKLEPKKAATEEKKKFVDNHPICFLMRFNKNGIRDRFINELLECAQQRERNPESVYLDNDENERFNREVANYIRRIANYNLNYEEYYKKYLNKMDKIDAKYGLRR